jgi:4-hydroxy 2-oxovalerate aldolase
MSSLLQRRKENMKMSNASSDTSSKYNLLDCTLRDGGYVNNWEFDTKAALDISDGLYKAGVRQIECGIMGIRKTPPGNSTKFNNFAEIEPLLQNKKPDCTYHVLVNYSEKDNFIIPRRSEHTVDCIRFAFFRNDWREALRYAPELVDKGYKLFVQPMATPLYGKDELLQLVEAVNRLNPEAFYIVDGFGTLFNDTLFEIADTADKALDNGIMLGFHAHNNMQMAFSNTMTFFNLQTKRERLIADSSIYGMGRGAGNVPIELIMRFLNSKYHTSYNIDYVMDIFDKYIRKIFEKNFWGYTMEYFLTADKNINSVYGWYLAQKGVSRLDEFNAILDKIPEESAYTLMKDVIDKILAEQNG